MYPTLSDGTEQRFQQVMQSGGGSREKKATFPTLQSYGCQGHSYNGDARGVQADCRSLQAV